MVGGGCTYDSASAASGSQKVMVSDGADAPDAGGVRWVLAYKGGVRWP